MAEQEDSPIEIGTRLEVFFDDFLIDETKGSARQRLHHPQPHNVIMQLDAPWDGDSAAYPSVIEDGGKVYLYYSARGGEGSEMTAVIESDDGIHFTRPVIGKIEFDGSTKNNLVHRGGISHNLSVFIDTNPDVPEEERFKAAGGRSNLAVLASADGVHWHRHVRVAEQRPFDSQNVVFWDAARGHYVAYMRAKPEISDGRRILKNVPQNELNKWIRDIRMSTSKDMEEWTEPRLIDYTRDHFQELYTNAIIPYPRAPHILIGFPKRFVPDRMKVEGHRSRGVSDALFMSSRDGILFDLWPEAFIRPGPEAQLWTDRNNRPAWGIVQTAPNEISLYWIEHYKHPTIRIRRGTVRTDGFVSVYADAEGGEFLTRPLIFSGDRLVVNYQTSAAGGIQFELTNEAGEPLPGFSYEDQDVLYGNEIAHMIEWNGQSDLGELKGQPVRLRVKLTDADLYSIRFESDEELRTHLTEAIQEALETTRNSDFAFAADRREALLAKVETLQERLQTDEAPSPAWIEGLNALAEAAHEYQEAQIAATRATRVIDQLEQIPTDGPAHTTAMEFLRHQLVASLKNPRASVQEITKRTAGLTTAMEDSD